MKRLNIHELTTEQKIGQLFVVRNYVNDEDREFVYEMLEKRAVGGVQIRVNDDCKAEAERVQSHADYPVLICADMERGFPLSQWQIPSMLSLGITCDEELAYQVGAVTAIEAKRHGFNTVWGPVVDLKNGNAMCKIPRILGSDPEHVAKMGTALLKGYCDNGMIASAKHWPIPLDETKDGHAFKSLSEMTEQDILDVVIKDKGVGIPDLEQARRPTYTTGGSERSGMGFTIMESFMTNFEVTSSPGKGTTVHMRRQIRQRQ